MCDVINPHFFSIWCVTSFWTTLKQFFLCFIKTLVVLIEKFLQSLIFDIFYILDAGEKLTPIFWGVFLLFLVTSYWAALDFFCFVQTLVMIVSCLASLASVAIIVVLYLRESNTTALISTTLSTSTTPSTTSNVCVNETSTTFVSTSNVFFRC